MIDKKDAIIKLFCLQNEKEFEFFSLSEEEKVKQLSKYVGNQSSISPLKDLFHQLGNEIDFTPDKEMTKVKKKDIMELNELKDKLFKLMDKE